MGSYADLNENRHVWLGYNASFIYSFQVNLKNPLESFDWEWADFALDFLPHSYSARKKIHSQPIFSRIVTLTFSILNDLGATGLHDSDARIGSTEINTNDSVAGKIKVRLISLD